MNKIDLSLQEAAKEAHKLNKGQFKIRERRPSEEIMAEIMAEANRPLTKQQKRFRDKCYAKGLDWGISDRNGIGTAFRRAE